MGTKEFGDLADFRGQISPGYHVQASSQIFLDRRVEVTMADQRPVPSPSNLTAPRFCSRCGAEPETERDRDASLCARCGDRLAYQGYCTTCESFWKLPAGAICPKHDIELIDEPPLTEFAGDHTKLVTVATYSHPNQANAPRIRLEAEGIPTFLDGERVAASTLYQVATGGVRLMVPAELASSARILIDQTWSAPDDDQDTEDAWDELAPQPGQKRRAIMKAAILVFLFGPLVLTLLGWLIRMAG